MGKVVSRFSPCCGLAIILGRIQKSPHVSNKGDCRPIRCKFLWLSQKWPFLTPNCLRVSRSQSCSDIPSTLTSTHHMLELVLLSIPCIALWEIFVSGRYALFSTYVRYNSHVLLPARHAKYFIYNQNLVRHKSIHTTNMLCHANAVWRSAQYTTAGRAQASPAVEVRNPLRSKTTWTNWTAPFCYLRV